MNKRLDLRISDISILEFLDILTCRHVDDPENMIKYLEFKGSYSQILLLVNEMI